jgi:hypothetical protein
VKEPVRIRILRKNKIFRHAKPGDLVEIEPQSARCMVRDGTAEYVPTLTPTTPETASIAPTETMTRRPGRPRKKGLIDEPGSDDPAGD